MLLYASAATLLCLLLLPQVPSAQAALGGNITILRVPLPWPRAACGANIQGHDESCCFINSTSSIAFTKYAQAARVPLLRVNAYPDDRTTATASFSDDKVAAILAVGAQPLLIVYLPNATNASGDYDPSLPGAAYPAFKGSHGYYLTTSDDTAGSIASSVAATVLKYTANNFTALGLQTPLRVQIGNEPDGLVDFRVPSPLYYTQIFQSVHDALVAADLRDSVSLCAPVVAGQYRWSDPAAESTLLIEGLLAAGSPVDVIDFHFYVSASSPQDLLMDTWKFDFQLDAGRPVDFVPGSATASNAPDYGVASLVARLLRAPSTRPGVGISISEHSGYMAGPSAPPASALHVTGLFHLGLTHHLLYNPRGKASTAFLYDASGDEQDGFGHFTAAGDPASAYWALYIRNVLTGPVVLPVTLVGSPADSSGTPWLLVTASLNAPGCGGGRSVAVEILNRNASTVFVPDVHVQGPGFDLSSVNLTTFLFTNATTPVSPAAGFAVTGTPDGLGGFFFSVDAPPMGVAVVCAPLVPLPPTAPMFAPAVFPTQSAVTPGGTAVFVFSSRSLVPGLAPCEICAVSVISGLPDQSTWQFNESLRSLRIAASANCLSGEYDVRLDVSCAGVSQPAQLNVSLHVLTPSISLFAGPPVIRSTSSQSNLATAVATNTTVSFTLLAAGGFSEGVVLALVNPSSLPPGVTIAPVSCAGGCPLRGSSSAKTSLTVAAGAPVGNFTLTWQLSCASCVTCDCSRGNLSSSSVLLQIA
jgi:hypothetical protein